MTEYWKNRLSARAGALYGELLRVARARGERASCGGADATEIREAYAALGRDHPELYFLPFDPHAEQSRGFGGVRTELVFPPVYNRAQMRDIDASIRAAEQELSRTAGGTEEERERAVCDYLLANTVYAVDNRYNQNAASALYAHRAQCSGIARAAKLLLNGLGMECLVLDGEAADGATGTLGAHSWNIVWVGGKPYHLDLTFMLGANPQRQKPYRYLFFNSSDAEMRKNHRWDERSVPACESSASPPPAGGGAHANAVSSLYEFKQQFRAAIAAGKSVYECYADIPVAEEELMKHIGGACKFVLDSLHTQLRVSISLRGREVTLKW